MPEESSGVAIQNRYCRSDVGFEKFKSNYPYAGGLPSRTLHFKEISHQAALTRQRRTVLIRCTVLLVVLGPRLDADLSCKRGGVHYPFDM